LYCFNYGCPERWLNSWFHGPDGIRHRSGNPAIHFLRRARPSSGAAFFLSRGESAGLERTELMNTALQHAELRQKGVECVSIDRLTMVVIVFRMSPGAW